MKSKLFIEIKENIELVKLHFQITNSLINQLKYEITKLHGKIAASEQTFFSNEKQIKKLCNIIDLADKEREKLEEDYCKIMSERDVIGTQLVCQNKDVDKLNKNIKDNNKTFLTRSTLDQILVGNEGEPTD